jgi:hypothetical protein
MPLVYSWWREGLPLPLSTRFTDHNRVLTIVNADLDDTGTYTCHVSRMASMTTRKSFYLAVQGEYIHTRDIYTDRGYTNRQGTHRQTGDTHTYIGHTDIHQNLLHVSRLPDDHCN